MLVLRSRPRGIPFSGVPSAHPASATSFGARKRDRTGEHVAAACRDSAVYVAAASGDRYSNTATKLGQHRARRSQFYIEPLISRALVRRSMAYLTPNMRTLWSSQISEVGGPCCFCQLLRNRTRVTQGDARDRCACRFYPPFMPPFQGGCILLHDDVHTTRSTTSQLLLSCRNPRFSLAAAQDVLFSSSPVKLHRLVNWSDGAASRSDVAGMQVSVFLLLIVDVSYSLRSLRTSPCDQLAPSHLRLVGRGSKPFYLSSLAFPSRFPSV